MKKIPILALNLSVDQEDKIKKCLNFSCFEIVHDEDKIDDFYVVVNEVDVAQDFLNLMLWGRQLYMNDEQCVFIDSYTPIKEALPQKASDKVFMRPWFSGYAFGGWKSKFDMIPKTVAERDLVQTIMDSKGQFVVSPFVSRVSDGVSDDPWIGNGKYKLTSKNGFHFSS